MMSILYNAGNTTSSTGTDFRNNERQSQPKRSRTKNLDDETETPDGIYTNEDTNLE